MEDYAKLYHLLFNAIIDALEQMNAQNFGSAKESLVTAQQKAEDLKSGTSKRRAEQCRAVRSAGWIIQKGGALPLPFGR